jgi:hypothetical protein
MARDTLISCDGEQAKLAATCKAASVCAVAGGGDVVPAK